ncbi:MAG: Multi-sensor signal transduction histidine kinase [Pedosphaera sp.]|nr:Multi-sensor signal transduction histidine kinase [Pedosphaera sp.]
MNKPLRILIVEDSEDDALFVFRALRRGGYELTQQRVDTEADFKAALTGEWDIIIADYSLPQFSALEALRLLQGSGIDLPFIIVSGAIGEEVAVAAMKSGAHDYILKNSLARLVPAVDRELREAHVRQERRRAEEAYLRLAAIVESSGDAIIGKKLDGTITSWNAGAERLYGYTEKQVAGHSMFMLLPPDRLEEEMLVLKRLKQGESIEHFETVRVRKDGRLIDVSVTISPVKDAEGRVIGAANIARDITERKRAQTCVAALSKLGQNLSSASTPEAAAYIIGNIADDLFGWDAFTLDLYASEEDLLSTVLRVDTIDGERRKVSSSIGTHKPGSIMRRVIEEGAELILREKNSKPLDDGSNSSVSLMYVSIRNQTRVIGIVSIQSQAVNAYERRDLSTLQTLADYCGGALERMRAREELQKSEERYRKLSDSAPIGIFENDVEGRCSYTNARWTTISGLSFEASREYGWLQAIHPEDRVAVEQDWRRSVAEGREWACEYRLQTPEGMVHWVRVQAASMVSRDGKHVGYVGTVEDITQSKKTADALRAAQQRLQHLVSSSPAVIYALKVNGDVLLPTWVSENIARLTGHGPEATLSSQWWAEHLHLRRGSHLLEEHAEENRVVEEYPFRRKDGTEIWIRDEKRLLFENGELVEVVGSWSDITERKLGEEELRNSREQLRALAAHLQSVREEERKRIAREIHDEIGQSLTGFKMDLAWMRNRLQADEGAGVQKMLLEKIGVMGKLLDETASGMRKLCTELRPGVLDDLGLTAAMEWQAREYRIRTGVQCELSIELGDLMVDAERSTALFRIFQEILTNVARHAKATRVDVTLRRTTKHLFLEVKDNGKGIKESEKAGRKSLGLVGMRERAFILGGEVEIEGQAGKGTAVRVKMPIPEETQEEGSDSNKVRRNERICPPATSLT